MRSLVLFEHVCFLGLGAVLALAVRFATKSRNLFYDGQLEYIQLQLRLQQPNFKSVREVAYSTMAQPGGRPHRLWLCIAACDARDYQTTPAASTGTTIWLRMYRYDAT